MLVLKIQSKAADILLKIDFSLRWQNNENTNIQVKVEYIVKPGLTATSPQWPPGRNSQITTKYDSLSRLPVLPV